MIINHWQWCLTLTAVLLSDCHWIPMSASWSSSLIKYCSYPFMFSEFTVNCVSYFKTYIRRDETESWNCCLYMTWVYQKLLEAWNNNYFTCSKPACSCIYIKKCPQKCNSQHILESLRTFKIIIIFFPSWIPLSCLCLARVQKQKEKKNKKAS